MYGLEIIENATDNIILELEWLPNDAAMNVAQNPTKTNFRLLVDGVVRTITDSSWGLSPILEIYADGAPAGLDFELIQDLYDANIQNTDGIKAIPGQSISVDVTP